MNLSSRRLKMKAVALDEFRREETVDWKADDKLVNWLDQWPGWSCNVVAGPVHLYQFQQEVDSERSSSSNRPDVYSLPTSIIETLSAFPHRFFSALCYPSDSEEHWQWKSCRWIRLFAVHCQWFSIDSFTRLFRRRLRLFPKRFHYFFTLRMTGISRSKITLKCLCVLSVSRDSARWSRIFGTGKAFGDHTTEIRRSNISKCLLLLLRRS